MLNEDDKARAYILAGSPELATTLDVRLLAGNVIELNRTLETALKKDGRIYGLKEAAALVEAAANKEVKIRIMVGKREQALRATNSKLLQNCVSLINRYSDDVANGTIPA